MSALDVFLSVRGVLGVSVSIDSPSKYSGNFLHLGKLETQIFDLCFFEMGLLLIALAPIASILYKAWGSYLCCHNILIAWPSLATKAVYDETTYGTYKTY